MTKPANSVRSTSTALGAMIFCLIASYAQATDKTTEPSEKAVTEQAAKAEAIKVDDDTFKCITEMTPVRHFYVDNLRGKLKETVSVAEKGKGDYPEGSVIQLVPTEAMVKQQSGFNPATRDWEFFALDVDKDGTKIYQRGYENVNNRFGLNCFTCHQQSEKDFDFVCEQDHGCGPIPVTRAMFGALQRTDPRCKNSQPVTAEDKQALSELEGVVKALKASAEPEKK